jgi:hypothetical protein
MKEDNSIIRYWEGLKSNCTYDFISKVRRAANHDLAGLMAVESFLQIKSGQFKGPIKFRKQLEEKGVNIIKSWDVRSFKSLAEIFPNAFPGWITQGQCSLEMLDEGWAFIKNK